jgi:hypothetical protein
MVKIPAKRIGSSSIPYPVFLLAYDACFSFTGKFVTASRTPLIVRTSTVIDNDNKQPLDRSVVVARAASHERLTEIPSLGDSPPNNMNQMVLL